jgi:hypothetical protein
MIKKIVAVGALALMAVAGSAQAAPLISFNNGSGALPAGMGVFQDFESVAPGTAIGPNAVAVNTSTDLAFRPAYGSTGNFGAVMDGGSYSIAFNPTGMFSFVLGSLDAFNVLTLGFVDGTSATYTGGEITNDMSYNSGSRTDMDTNGRVTYTVNSGPLINSATFRSSGGNSFEFDNLAAAVPEPAMWGMMILGFGLVGAALRRSDRKFDAKIKAAWAAAEA